MGARPLARLIDNKIKSPLSRRILFGDLKDGGVVTVSIKNDDLDFATSAYVKPLTKAEKKAIKAATVVVNDNAETETNNL
jgi:hypothetical protein